MVVMGRVRAPHGLKGWIKIQPFTHEVGGLLGYQEWWLGSEGSWQPHHVAESTVHGSVVVARLDGVVGRQEAAELKGRDVAVPRSALPQNRADEFYWNDLLGMAVCNHTADEFGIVAKILETGANAVLVVQGAREVLIPFIRHVIVDVDLTARRIVVDWETS